MSTTDQNNTGQINNSRAELLFPLLDCREEVVRYFRHKSLSAEDAEDLTQETYSRYLSAYGQAVKSLSQARAILFTIARNLSHDFFRRKSHRPEAPLNSADEDFDTTAITDDSGSPERHYSATEEIELINKILLSLPRRQRQVFLLRRVDGLKYKDIARRCGISVSTVEKEVAEAIAALVGAQINAREKPPKKGFRDDKR